MAVRRNATHSGRLRGKAATRHLSSVICHPSSGFTLVEMIMVIVITGIIGGMVAVFLKAPMQQYIDVARRADMTDVADTALRRIGRDVRLALPNSVRVTGACGGAGTTCFIEFLPTRGGDRYRAGPETAGASAGCGSLALDALDFTAADTCFEVLGAMPPGLVAGDRVVVYNQGTGTGADAYAGDNTGLYSSNTVATITINPGKQFPLASPSSRFQVISTPVSYVCAPALNGIGGTLTRYWNYQIQAAQPATVATLTGFAGVQSALLANNVSACNFSYQANVVAERSGLVTMNLAITNSGETVTLYSATHVSNEP
ncbi:MAG: type II secretion system protein [Nitrosomonadales bacterium]|nr:type II secretion system protein [Nitrosomonadales bacterium]